MGERAIMSEQHGLDEDADLRGASRSETGLFRRALARLSDIVMPPVCLVCRTPVGGHDALCAACWREVDLSAHLSAIAWACPCRSTSRLSVPMVR